MLAGNWKVLMVAAAVALAIGAPAATGGRPTTPPAARRVHHAPAWQAAQAEQSDEGCREIPAPAAPLSTPPPPSAAAASCS